MLAHDTKLSANAVANAAALRARLDLAVPIFILIDPIAGEPLPSANGSEQGTQAAREALWDRPVFPITLTSVVPLKPYQYPYLVALEGIDDPWLESTLDMAQDERLAAQADGLDGEGTAVHRIGGWIQTLLPGAEIAARLAFMFQLNTDASTQATYLRLLDRRVLGLLRHVVGDARLTALFGRLQRWAYLDAQGAIATLNGSSVDDVALHLTQDEWHRMQQGEVLNPALALWLGEAARSGHAQLKPAAMLYEPLFQSAKLAQTAAQQWPQRFQQPKDQSFWAALCLLYPDLANNAQAAQLLNKPGTQLDPVQPLRYIQQQLKACVAPATAAHPDRPV